MDMPSVPSAQHEGGLVMSSEENSSKDCCEQSGLIDAQLFMFECDSVCVAINYYLETGDSLVSNVPIVDSSPINVDDSVLAGFASIDPRPPRTIFSQKVLINLI